MNLNRLPKLHELIPATKVLVLAPHMDDEIIGCGGVIYKYSKASIPVSIVYTTLGNKDIFNKIPPAELHRIRVEESKRSSQILEVKKSYFLNNNDSSDDPWHLRPAKLMSILQNEKPDLVMLPYYEDAHSDHVKTNYLFKNCVNMGFNCYVAAYEVWSPMQEPSCIVNITKEMDIKISAIKEHKSQLKYLKYDKMCLGLNQYRSVFFPFPGIEYAEAFHHEYAETYINKFELEKEAALIK